MRIVVVIITMMFLIPGVNVPVGQTARTELKTTGCEFNDAVLDTLSQKTRRDQIVIVIARLGASESRKNLNQRRLHNVMIYLTQFITPEGGRRKESDIVLAEGEGKTASGMIEVYAGGKLYDTLQPAENADLFVGTCVPDQPGQDVCSNSNDKNFYPCLDRTKAD